MSVTLPLVKTTPGALKYGVPDHSSQLVGTVYVRKNKLRAAGHSGSWPTEITITVEVP